MREKMGLYTNRDVSLMSHRINSQKTSNAFRTSASPLTSHVHMLEPVHHAHRKMVEISRGHEVRCVVGVKTLLVARVAG